MWQFKIKNVIKKPFETIKISESKKSYDNFDKYLR